MCYLLRKKLLDLFFKQILKDGFGRICYKFLRAILFGDCFKSLTRVSVRDPFISFGERDFILSIFAYII